MRWNQEQDAVLLSGYSDYGIDWACSQLGKTRGSVIARAFLLGLTRKHITHNDTYFDTIDSEEKAYILGLIASDGCIYDQYGAHQLLFRIAKHDYQLAKFVRDRLSPDSNITTYISNTNLGITTMCKLVICSKYMVNSLAKHGVVQNKIGKFVFPWHIPGEVYSSFVLGYFDGDGSAGIYNGKPVWEIYCCNPVFLQSVAQCLFDDIGITPAISPSRDTYVLAAYGNRARKIDEWLHKDGLGLQRKQLHPQP